MSSTVGIREVAILAGVSTATVSRSLNAPDSVRKALRDRVVAAVQASGYVPNAGARALSTNRSLTIGAVIPTVDNAMFAAGLEEAEQTLAGQGFHLLIATTRYDPVAELEVVRTMLARGVDGFLFMGDNHLPESMALLRAQRRPWINLGVWRPDWNMKQHAPSVGFDNIDASRQIARFLLDLGHTRIAMLAGVSRDNDRAAGRIEGMRQALMEAGLSLRVSEHPYSVEEGRMGLRALLAAGDDRPTAVACGNDVLAFGALAEAKAQRIEVPKTLSIVGFDDLEMARHQDPPLTTLRIDTRKMWRLGALGLLSALNGHTEPKQQRVEAALIVRGSTARATPD